MKKYQALIHFLELLYIKEQYNINIILTCTKAEPVLMNVMLFFVREKVTLLLRKSNEKRKEGRGIDQLEIPNNLKKEYRKRATNDDA